ncbi:MAG: diguanylate cyclase [Luteitalea sp.]|nr:diguanylate cyclase [Luteitalea sp.]
MQRRLTERVAELQLARDHLARLASTDALTRLHSRGWWFELATNEYSRSRQSGCVFSQLAIDLDFFKKVNDTHGHDAGDRVLQQFADMLRRECRQSDIVGRLGGEEFALLLPETTSTQAQALARRLTEECRALVVPSRGASVRFTCSIGISQLRAGDDSFEAVLSRADAALYDAKRSGRDCWKSDLAPHSADQAPDPAPPSPAAATSGTARPSDGTTATA